MGWRDDLSNFDMSRLTVVGWLFFFVSSAVGFGTAIVVGACWENWFPLQPGARPRGTRATGFAGAGGALGFFFLARGALALIGIRIVRAKEDLSGLTADKAIIELRRQVSRAREWRLFFKLLTPLGFIVPLGLALALAFSSVSPAPEGITLTQILGMTALAVPIFGVVGWLLMNGDVKKKHRALTEAEQGGLNNEAKIQTH